MLLLIFTGYVAKFLRSNNSVLCPSLVTPIPLSPDSLMHSTGCEEIDVGSLISLDHDFNQINELGTQKKLTFVLNIYLSSELSRLSFI